ncbi:MAG: universal stress protein [Rhodospirillales bacterium]|jgi:nucleotide-binding universal stress UspA family protein|nr:universal stress protein [Rhodospirillales bacterium]MBT4041374.1 universal stress protein [Rhodospirillales bacterium]MBT4628183.1 universal stress protein [Rhodospirillales bacterium]MBT5353274.1 universal stress protein [Rhodospirillales bacterium]MBT5519966.1 universal stress protein [Rhodospirillales bacterium]
MTIKSILAPLDGSDSSENALRAALTMAGQCGAHVDALHVRTNPKDAVPLLGEGMSGAVIEDIIVAAERESNERAHNARSVFDKVCESQGVTIVDEPPSDEEISARWVEETGREDEATGLRGRLADLIVLPRPTPESSVSATMTLNAALVETGRAVLVVPEGQQESIGRRIAISWNGSAEAARAVAAALPLIEKADRVLVLTIDGDEAPAKVTSELSDYLLWHGVSTDMDVSPVTDRQVGETVLSKCADWNADLLVMGAYTHSRLRQLIMGGVTSYVLSEATLPVVMVN